MKVINEELYHIHREGIMDDLWKPKNFLTVDFSFESFFYQQLLEAEKPLLQRFPNGYDIDFIITIMEEMKWKGAVSESNIHNFDFLLNCYYVLRRELALESGRNLYQKDAPSRLRSIFLADSTSLSYWEKAVGNHSYQTVLVRLDGNLFVSSDLLFPDSNLMFEQQVEESRNYWKVKSKDLSVQKEFLFQGTVQIIE